MSIFVTVGPSGIDHYFAAGCWPQLGAKVMLTDHTVRIGGMMANTAAALGAAGMRVTHLERIGPQLCDEVLASLQRFGVDTSLVQVDPAARTCQTYVVRVGAERTILIDDDGRVAVEVTATVAAALAAAQVIVTSLPEMRQPAVRAAILAAVAQGARLALDIEVAGLGDPGLDAGSVAAASYLVINQQAGAAVDVAGLAARGCEVVVTLGADGVDLVQAGGTRHIAAPRVEPLDTTGASDTFLAVYVARRWEGHAPPAAAQAGVVAAARATEGIGPRAGAEYLAGIGPGARQGARPGAGQGAGQGASAGCKAEQGD